MKNLQEIQTALRQYFPEVKQKYHVQQLGIFGSFVRGEQTENSDVDVLVEFDPNTRFGLLTFCALENELSIITQMLNDLSNAWCPVRETPMVSQITKGQAL
jgi:uncharacterized protein